MNPAVSPYLACEIDAGKCAVLEAAAGTGKTYNITNIKSVHMLLLLNNYIIFYCFKLINF